MLKPFRVLRGLRWAILLICVLLTISTGLGSLLSFCGIPFCWVLPIKNRNWIVIDINQGRLRSSYCYMTVLTAEDLLAANISREYARLLREITHDSVPQSPEVDPRDWGDSVVNRAFDAIRIEPALETTSPPQIPQAADSLAQAYRKIVNSYDYVELPAPEPLEARIKQETLQFRKNYSKSHFLYQSGRPIRSTPYRNIRNTMYYDDTVLIFPLWLASIVFALPIVALLRAPLRRLRRRRGGCCTRCGYNLTGAEHEKCPECGAGVAGRTAGEIHRVA